MKINKISAGKSKENNPAEGNIIPIDKENSIHRAALLDLLVEYFATLNYHDPADAVPPQHVPKICGHILDGEWHDHSMYWLYFYNIQDEHVGFIIAQIDTPKSDWCKREGWGFIRECFVRPDFRRRGIARSLVSKVEKDIIDAGAKDIYLTSDEEAIAFWQSVGYLDSGSVYEKNMQKIYVKSIGEAK